jgi:single-strand DNA-binding protein
MPSLNTVQIMGHAGKDAEVRYTQNGLAVATFSIATSSYTKSKEQKTEWHNIVAFGKTAEYCRDVLKKGDLVFVIGSLTTSSYDKNGVKMYSTKVLAEKLVVATVKKGISHANAGTSTAGNETGNSHNQSGTANEPPPFDDDLPF